VTFLKYDFPLLFPLKKHLGIKVADGRDIGCMKISAISSRGAKKILLTYTLFAKRCYPLKDF